MSDDDKTQATLLGIALIGTALLPTPDDVTVISPALQLIGGFVLLAYGIFA